MATTSRRASFEDSPLARRLRKELEGEVLFDRFSRGRYSTDASIYQVEPIGVVIPRCEEDVTRAVEIAAAEDVPVLPRGGGTSQCGQTVGRALVIDTSKFLRGILDLDIDKRTICVQPGLVLDNLNKSLRPHDLFFPVDPSTASRATIGGMAGNNSCGARSVQYGNMIHNVRAVDAVLADGETLQFGLVPGDLKDLGGSARYRELIERVRSVSARESDEIARRFPKLLRRVGGYNIDSVGPDGHNMAHLLIGSEGTLALFTRVYQDLHPLPSHRVLGILHFPTLYQALDCTRHLVEMKPSAVELVDRTMIDLARDLPAFRTTVDHFAKGESEAILLVEFAGENLNEQLHRLKQLGELMESFGFPDAVVEAVDPTLQNSIWEVRKAGLNILMSMKGEGKPVSFIEDCAVGLDDLADYTDRLNTLFAEYGTKGTWYAHASVGCLHVRPILNMKDEADVKKMRAIAEEAFALVQQYKGSHSGEHGDGIVRSEFHEAMFGSRIVEAFEEVKDAFDPDGLFNPGKIVRPPRMDDRSLFRYKPDYKELKIDTVLDWSVWDGFLGAVEMCNNNGACRKSAPGVMCPSYRVTADEQHLTRGRANTLRLALTGQLGPQTLASDAMYETMDLCVGCKACKRECPMGVDVARMKIEFLHHYRKRHRLGVGERLIAYLPRYAPWASRFPFLTNLRDRIPGLAGMSEKLTGLSARRRLPAWRRDVFATGRRDGEVGRTGDDGREVALLLDCFNTYFEPENVHATRAVLKAGGYRVELPRATEGRRPLCCGRTFLAVGLVDEARAEARRMVDSLKPYVERGVPIVGLEPACLLTLRDEFKAILPGGDTDALASRAMLLEEFLQIEHKANALNLGLRQVPWRRALVHGHCHQKAFGLVGCVEDILRLVPDLEVDVIETSCCGMAGAFGYEAVHYDVSVRMAELDLLPAVRAAGDDTLVVADGTSCRHQIRDLAARDAVHVAQVLQTALT